MNDQLCSRTLGCTLLPGHEGLCSEAARLHADAAAAATADSGLPCDRMVGCSLGRGHKPPCRQGETGRVGLVESKIVAPKKLIEVALPLDEINKAAAREKSIRHGHPSTLHLWWARRPLAAARAVLFAQLVNDPSWKYTEEQQKQSAIKGVITRERNRLHSILIQLVQWESTTNETILEAARAEIRKSWEETCEANKDHPEAKTVFDKTKLPEFHDPFAGGGAIPLEAQRLGLVAHATDLNPVAVLINKAMIEIPPKFAGRKPVGPAQKSGKQVKNAALDDWSGAKGLAEDVRRYGQWMREEAEKRIGHLYPKITITDEMVKGRPDLKPYTGQALTVIAWLWARTVKSPNPAFSNVDVPLASSFLLSTKPGKEAWVAPVVDCGGFRFTVRTGGKPPAGAAEGTKLSRGANFRCLMSTSPIAPEHIYAEANAGRMASRLMAIVAEGGRGRVYLSPTTEMEAIATTAKATWKPTVAMPDNPRWFSPPLYGLKTYGDLFTPRQLVALTTFSDLVQEARARVKEDAVAAGFADDGKGIEAGGVGAAAYSDTIAIFLALSVSKMADAQSSLCRWKQSMDQSIATFGRHALPMVWDFSEANALGNMAGDPLVSLKTMMRALEAVPCGRGTAEQQDARVQTVSTNRAVSTDPPYYDNIGYADLSDFFYVWLRRSLSGILPRLFTTMAVPKAEELVATPYRHGGKDNAESFFLDGMKSALAQIRYLSNLALPVTVYYAFKQSETQTDGTSSTGWETFLEAMLGAGFAIGGTWPMRTELANRMIGSGTNALASSIVLVCRPRGDDAAAVSRKDFVRELERALPRAIEEMIADPIAAIAPVDLAQASIGPGMAIFSKYRAVLEADGSPMTVHTALVHINKVVDVHFAGDSAGFDLDADSRFCIGWFDEHGFVDGDFGRANTLAQAKGTSVEGVVEAGVLKAQKGKVRLLKIEELPADWDPTNDTRTPTWEALHHLCRALDESEAAAGTLLSKMLDRTDAIRALAYRLYTLCERKKWAEQAGHYNALITSWPAIVEASQKSPTKQMDLV